MMIGSARMVDNLYYFDDNFLRIKQAQSFSTSISSLSFREQIMIWHLRLGILVFLIWNIYFLFYLKM